MTRHPYRARLFPTWVYHFRDAAALAGALTAIFYGFALVLEPILAGPTL